MSARAAMGGAALVLLVAVGHAEPLRLRGNVYASTREQTPAGLLTLDADSALRPWLSAEAVVWLGTGQDSEADAMVVALHFRDPEHRAEARVGRFLVVPGAVRPVHLDGVHGRVRGPWDMSAEVFGGVPVMPGFAAAAYDWAAGGRVARGLGDVGAVGVAYMQRRNRGQLDDHEVGVDGGMAVLPWLDVAGRLAYDLVYPGVSDGYLSLSARRRSGRLELFWGHRSPSRLLPATSLFSVLGDVASDTAGTTATWRAAPRLDVTGTAAVRAHGGEDVGAELRLRGLLRLDDRGAGTVLVELRRDAVPGAEWSGARMAARVPVNARVQVAAEVEVAVPDDSGDKGRVWPWALGAVDWQVAPGWQASAAVEAGASPVYRYRVDGMVRVSRAWEVGR